MLNVSHAGGTAWVCSPDCGIKEMHGRGSGAVWSAEVGKPGSPLSGHMGWYHVGEITASVPAASRAEDRGQSADGDSPRQGAK